MDTLFQIGLIFLLVFLNGYFVASEFALVAIRKTRVRELSKKGNTTAKILLNALGDLESYISATQLGITLASLGLGWAGEPVIAHLIEPFISFLPLEISLVTAHTISVVLAFSLITFLHIVLGELAPKSLALANSERVSLFVITPLVVFTKVFRPFIWILNSAGQFVLRMFGLNAPSARQLVHSEEEIRMLLSQSAEEGAIPSDEVEMVNKVFQLGDNTIKYVMIPRSEILAFEIASTLGDVVKRIERHPHSRFPVFEENLDKVIGFVHIKDIYREILKHGPAKSLSSLRIIRTILLTSENTKVDDVLSQMRQKRTHISLVTDEFMMTKGMVTLEDIMESLVGEIQDEFEESVVNIAKQKDGTYLVKGHTHISSFQERFKLPIKGQGYTTIGGLVFGILGHEPRIGDEVEVSNLVLKVEEIERGRIKTLEIRKKKRKKQ